MGANPGVPEAREGLEMQHRNGSSRQPVQLIFRDADVSPRHTLAAARKRSNLAFGPTCDSSGLTFPNILGVTGLASVPPAREACLTKQHEHGPAIAASRFVHSSVILLSWTGTRSVYFADEPLRRWIAMEDFRGTLPLALLNDKVFLDHSIFLVKKFLW